MNKLTDEIKEILENSHYLKNDLSGAVYNYDVREFLEKYINNHTESELFKNGFKKLKEQNGNIWYITAGRYRFDFAEFDNIFIYLFSYDLIKKRCKI